MYIEADVTSNKDTTAGIVKSHASKVRKSAASKKDTVGKVKPGKSSKKKVAEKKGVCKCAVMHFIH